MALLIGIDIGTQGTKTAVFAKDGRVVASAFRASRILRPSPDAVEEDPEDQLAAVCSTVRTCTAGLPVNDVAGLAIAGQMAGIIGIGADGRAITPYDSWLDTRCSPQIGEMRRKAGKRIISRSGGPVGFNHGPKILWWKKHHPAVYRKVRAFVQPGGYAAMQLCELGAGDAFIDHTYLHFSGFSDTRKAVWDKGLCGDFGIDPEKLPRIVEPQRIIGSLSAKMARACGLRPGIPVVAGCGDTAGSFLSCGAVRPGTCVDVAGTASVFAATTTSFIGDQGGTLACGRSAVPGLWHPYAYVNGGGMNLEWFRQQFAKGRPLTELDAGLEEVRGEPDLPFFLPHLSGRSCPSQPALRGAWAGVTRDHGPAHLYHAVLESIALEYSVYAHALKALDPESDLREIRVTGGGERSAAWNAIKAATLGCRVVQMANNAGAAMGAALIAGWGTGTLPDLAKAAGKWAVTGTVTRPARHPSRTARLERYRSLLTHLHDWSTP